MSKINNERDAEWKAKLSHVAYRVTRKGETERAFSGAYNDHKASGKYVCACCGAALFSSKDKYDSGTGWPSFFQEISKGSVSEHSDFSIFAKRTEVRCNECDAHLGHVFPDGPKPTGLRYCINSVALDFKT